MKSMKLSMSTRDSMTAQAAGSLRSCDWANSRSSSQCTVSPLSTPNVMAEEVT